MTLTPFCLASSLSLWYTTVQQSKLKCVEQLALRISNIKLCHTVLFQITLFTSLSFQKKKKKSKRYSNSTQFKFFFSCLNFPKEEFQKHTLEQGCCPKRLLGSSTVRRLGVCLSRVTLARTFKCGRSWGLCSLEAK